MEHATQHSRRMVAAARSDSSLNHRGDRPVDEFANNAAKHPSSESTLAAIVPLYNEQTTVVELLSRLISQPCISQIVIVDDGSTDQSVPAVKEWLACLPQETADRILLLHHDVNRGKGRAIRTGLDRVTCTHVIIQDADLEYDPADINKLWAVMLDGSADAVFGSRYPENPSLQRGRWVMQSGVSLKSVVALSAASCGMINAAIFGACADMKVRPNSPCVTTVRVCGQGTACWGIGETSLSGDFQTDLYSVGNYGHGSGSFAPCRQGMPMRKRQVA